MKKKIAIILLSLVAALCLAFGLAACSDMEEEGGTPGGGEHTHTYSDEWTADGSYHWHAATCGDTDEVSDYAAHTWNGGVVTTAAGCTTNGVKTYTCTVCGATRTETIAATGHDYSMVWSSNDSAHWYACNNGCGSTSGYAEHAWSDVVVTEEATCTTDGKIIYTCTVCGYNHTEAIPATGHSFTNYVPDGKATCTADGTKTATCDNGCGTTDTVTEEGTATGHTAGEAVKESEVAAACTTDGSYDEVIYCAVCGAELSRETVIVAATGHSYAGWEAVDEKTHQRKCKSCGNTEYGTHDFNNKVCRVCDFIINYTPGLGYTLSDDGTYYIVSGIGTASETDIIIPSVYGGLPVTDIGAYAFQNCTSLTSITIPDGVTSIGNYAFDYCASVKNITIPDSVISIGEHAFFNCILLEGVTIGSGLTSVGDSAFEGCSSLTGVTIPDGVTSIGKYAFKNCTALTSVTIGESVTSIGNEAFYNCTLLTEIYYNAAACEDLDIYNDVFHRAGQSGDGIKVIIGANVGRIPAWLFNPYYSIYTAKIVSAIFEDGSVCTSIGSSAFQNCTSLTSITIPDSITSIGSSAFYNCTALKTVYITDITAWCSISFGNTYSNPLYYASNFYLNEDVISGNIKIGSGATSVPAYTFKNSSITGVIIPDSVTAIGEHAFYNCTSLESVTIGNGVTSIGSYAFYCCSSLTSITIPDGVTYIGERAFYNCTSLTEIYYNATACEDLSSSNRVFYNAGKNGDGITVTIGANVKKIPAYLFYSSSSTSYAPKIVSVVFEEGSKCTSIGDYAFAYLTLLTSIEIPEAVTAIGEYAFRDCTAEIIWGDNPAITEIGDYAFAYYAGTSIAIPEAVTAIGEYAFRDCTAEIIWGDNPAITEIGGYAFAYYSGTSIIIPDSITYIGEYAFYGCTALTEIYYNATACEDLSSGNCVFYDAGKNGDGITVTIGTNVEKIPAYLFNPFSNSSYSPNIVSVVFEEGSACTSIGSYAFYGCTSVAEVYITDLSAWIDIGFGNEYANPLYYAGDLFLNDYLVTELVIPDGTTSVGDYAFYGCTSLVSISIPDSVTEIGDYAFYNCYKLVEVYNFSDLDIAAGSTDNGYVAYYAKNVYPDEEDNRLSVTDDGFIFYTDDGSGEYYLVGYEGSSTDITLPESINEHDYEIYDYAFYNNTSLKSITIGGGVTSIGEYAFAYAEAEIIWDNPSITEITSYAFAYYLGTSIEIPNSVIDICDNAFYGCSNLTNIVVPDNVTSIGSAAFGGCSSLESITLPFVGSSSIASSASGSTLFGYIFGTGKYTGGTATTQYYESSTSVTYYIPTSLVSVTITGGSILYGAFYNCSLIESVITDSGVSIIGNYAFYNCTSLKDVTIGNGITSIGISAFRNCTSLTNIVIPDTVTSIGSSAFNGCSSLESMTLPFVGSNGTASAASSSTLFGSIFGTDSYTGGTATSQKYSSSSTAKTYYIPTSLVSVTITGGKIYYGAFYNCSKLTNVVIGSGVTSIGASAFYKCSSLTNIVIADSVTSIGSAAFSGCSSLESMTLPFVGGSSTSSSTSSSTFGYIFGTSSYTGGTATVQRGNTYYIPASLTTVNITGGTLDYAFYNCSNLTSITIGSGVTSIGTYAFYRCTSLTSFIIPDSVTSVGDSAFLSCSSLAEITIGSGVKSIGEFAFRDCTSLTSITIPNSVTSVGERAFYGCTALTDITIGSGVTSVGSNAFYNCTALESVYITDLTAWCNIEFEDDYANPMYYADNLYLNGLPVSGNVVLEEGVTAIPYGTFKNSDITSITIPDGVTSIGSYAFYNCRSLTSVTMGGGVTSIGDYAFHNCISLTSIAIGSGVTSVGSYAFYNCTSLADVTIPEGVTFIGYRAFYNCNKLASVTFENTSGWWYADSPTAESGTEIESEYLADPATAAEYLAGTHCNYYWNCG